METTFGRTVETRCIVLGANRSNQTETLQRKKFSNPCLSEFNDLTNRSFNCQYNNKINLNNQIIDINNHFIDANYAKLTSSSVLSRKNMQHLGSYSSVGYSSDSECTRQLTRFKTNPSNNLNKNSYTNAKPEYVQNNYSITDYLNSERERKESHHHHEYIQQKNQFEDEDLRSCVSISNRPSINNETLYQKPKLNRYKSIDRQQSKFSKQNQIYSNIVNSQNSSNRNNTTSSLLTTNATNLNQASRNIYQNNENRIDHLLSPNVRSKFNRTSNDELLKKAKFILNDFNNKVTLNMSSNSESKSSTNLNNFLTWKSFNCNPNELAERKQSIESQKIEDARVKLESQINSMRIKFKNNYVCDGYSIKNCAETGFNGLTKQNPLENNRSVSTPGTPLLTSYTLPR